MKMKTWKFLPIMAMGVCMAMTSCSEDSKKEDVSPNPFAGFNTPDSGTATDDELKELQKELIAKPDKGVLIQVHVGYVR